MRIVLCPNPDRDTDYALTARVANLLKRNCAQVAVCPVCTDHEPELPVVCGIQATRLDKELENRPDVVVTFGGDGTILHAARMLAPVGVPILGLNMGHLGFIADLERDEAGLILKLLSGGYRIEQRMMLDVALERGGQIVLRDCALNDVVLRGAYRPVSMAVACDGQPMSTFSGDGVILSTPTGSTAYSMAAGGPVVDPDAENIIITPLNAHVLYARSFVLAPERAISVTPGGLDTRSAYCTVDGNEPVSLEPGDIVHVTRSACQAKLVKISERSFYGKLYSKLGGRS